MDAKLLKGMIEQVNKEYFSGYLYLGMSDWFNAKGLKGFANWCYVQYLEEREHGNGFFRHLNYRGQTVDLKAIAAPTVNFSSALDVFKKVLEHEQMITASINDLATQASKVNDHASYAFLKWYVEEQLEEEDNAQDIIDKLELGNQSGNTLLILDGHLAKREFKPASIPMTEG